MSKIKLFCIPYAGASAVVYSKWKKSLAEFVELYEVELPGRGKRYSEPFSNSIEEVVEDIFKQIKDQLSDGGRYSFFGHSMGSIIVYELVYKIRELLNSNPVHIFFSGRSSPDFKEEDKVMYMLPEDEFKIEIKKFGGMTDEIFENNELAKIFLPILRADYKLIDTYEYLEKDQKLNCNLSVLYGTNDLYIKSDINQWRKFTDKQCNFIGYEGGHFFINPHMERVIKVINDTLSIYKY